MVVCFKLMRKDMNKEQVLNKAEDWADQVSRDI